MEISHSDMIRGYDKWLPGLMGISGFYAYARQVYDYLVDFYFRAKEQKLEKAVLL